MTTRHRTPESYLALRLAGRLAFRVPVATCARITRIIGRERVNAVEIEDGATGQRRRVDCDLVVVTGDWVPDHELAHLARLDLDDATGAPVVDAALRTSRPGVFAAGNLVHPADTADVAALDGRHVAAQVRAWLNGHRPATTAVRLRTRPPFRWISPGLIGPTDQPPSRKRLLLWSDRLVRIPHIRISQDGRVIARRTLPWPASPGRMFRIPWALLQAIDVGGGDVVVGLDDGPDR